jgi:hypothetical protein
MPEATIDIAEVCPASNCSHANLSDIQHDAQIPGVVEIAQHNKQPRPIAALPCRVCHNVHVRPASLHKPHICQGWLRLVHLISVVIVG